MSAPHTACFSFRSESSQDLFYFHFPARQAATHMASDRAPSFSQTLKPSEIQAGGRVRFECKVDGRPKPTVEWNKVNCF